MPRVLVISVIFIRSVCGQTAAPPQSPFTPDTPAGSHAALDLRVPGSDLNGWQYPISRLNEALPSWIQFGGQLRDRVESEDGIGYAPVNDTYNLTQIRFGVYVQPAKWLEFVGVTQDARVFFNQHVKDAPPYRNIWDIREAYVQLGSSTTGWFDVVAGRQIFSFGDERVIGPSDWLNMGRTFDTVRLDLHPPGAKVSIFAASVINAVEGTIDHHIEGNNIYGIYSSLTRVIPHATLEPYLLWRVAPGNVPLPETAGRGHLSEVTGGVRIAGTVPVNLDYDAEMNWQTGSLGHYSISAWAGHLNLGYTFKDTPATPRLFSEYNYASGNKDPNSNTWGTHDELYPSAHNKMEFADQFGWKNIEDLRAGASEKLSKRWDLTQIFNDLWLATKNDAVYGTSGAVAISAHPAANSRHLGVELDAVAEFKQTQHVTYGFGIGHIFPGKFLDEATCGKDFNYPFAYATYIF